MSLPYDKTPLKAKIITKISSTVNWGESEHWKAMSKFSCSVSVLTAPQMKARHLSFEDQVWNFIHFSNKWYFNPDLLTQLSKLVMDDRAVCDDTNLIWLLSPQILTLAHFSLFFSSFLYLSWHLKLDVLCAMYKTIQITKISLFHLFFG